MHASSSCRTRHIIQPTGTGKTEALIQEACFLLRQGLGSELLILTRHATQAARFKGRLLTALNAPTGMLPVYTYAGWVRSSLFELWPLVLEKHLEKTSNTQKTTSSKTLGMPELIGFRESSLLLQKLLQHPTHSLPEALRPYINPAPDYIVAQLLRRWRLRCEQGLSQEALQQSSTALAEAYGMPPMVIQHAWLPWLKGIERAFIQRMFAMQWFDPAAQYIVFERLLGCSPTAQPDIHSEVSQKAATWMTQRVKHLLVDDLQDALPSQNRFVTWLQNSLQTLILTKTEDPLETLVASKHLETLSPLKDTYQHLYHGGIRHHSMANTDPEAQTQLLQTGHTTPALSTHTYEEAAHVFQAWFTPHTPLPATSPQAQLTQVPQTLQPITLRTTPQEMVAALDGWISERLAEGSPPDTWLWICPQYDSAWVWLLKQSLTRHGLSFQWLQTPHKLTEDPALCRWLVLLRLILTPETSLATLAKTTQNTSGRYADLPSETPFSFQMLLESLPHWLGIHPFNPAAMPALHQALITSLDLGFEPLENDNPNDEAPPTTGAISSLLQGASAPWHQRFHQFYEWVGTSRARYEATQDFESLFFEAFQHYLAPHLKAFSPSMPSPYEGLLTSYRAFKAMHQTPNDTNPSPPEATLTLEWLDHLLNTSIFNTEDTPLLPEDTYPESLWISTPQYALEASLRRPHVLLLDSYNPLWCKHDHTKFYHAWLMSSRWPEWPYTLYRHYYPNETTPTLPQLTHWLLHSKGAEALIQYRAAHQTHALILLAQAKVWCFASETDLLGQPYPPTQHLASVLGQAYPSLLCDSQTLALELAQTRTLQTLTPRADQALALAYQGGAMAIQAVPGAGKTFTSIALLVHLIARFESGSHRHPQNLQESTDEENLPEAPPFVPHPNRIWVVTYMESAAHTLRKRLQTHFPHKPSYQLPHISTLHALALKILQHAHRETPTLIDPALKQSLLMEVARQTLPEYTPQELWFSTLETLFSKLTFTLLPYRAQTLAHAASPRPWEDALQAWSPCPQGHPQLTALYQAWGVYHQMMQELNQVDFDHLIAEAVLHLQAYPDTRMFFQSQCELVIEDEAQDSSEALQMLLTQLLGTSNLIRVGDTNQSITTTFTSATTDIFRNFAQHPDTQCVQLHFSSRSAVAIQTLANLWLSQSSEWIPESQGAFQPAMLTPTEDNPSLVGPITWYEAHDIHEECQQAWHWLHHHVTQSLQANHDEDTPTHKPIERVAVLCRTKERCDLIRDLLQKQQQYQKASLQACMDIHYLIEEEGGLGGYTQDTLRAWFRTALTCLDALQTHEDLPYPAMVDMASEETASERHVAPQENKTQWDFDWYMMKQTAQQQNVYTLLETLHRFMGTHPAHQDVTLPYPSLITHFERFQALQSQLRQQLQHLPQPVCESTLHTLRRFLTHVIQHKDFSLYQSLPTPSSPQTQRINTQGPAPHTVTLSIMTVHKSKGQEFPLVLLMGCDGKQYPMRLEGTPTSHTPDALTLKGSDVLWRDALLYHTLHQATPSGASGSRSSQTIQKFKDTLAHDLLKSKLAEECRLIYVGLTRAERGLWMSYSQHTTPTKKASRPLPPALWWTHLYHHRTHLNPEDTQLLTP
jgi:superfamily I DNA/RNA helicase